MNHWLENASYTNQFVEVTEDNNLVVLNDTAEANAKAVALDKATIDADAIRNTNVDLDNVTANLKDLSAGALKTGSVKGSTITWTSSKPLVIAANGTVTRPIFSAGDATVTLTATVTKGDVMDTVEFTVTVLKKDFLAAGKSIPDATFTITPDGYALTDFSAAAGSIEFDNGNLPTIDVNGITYTITYVNGTGVATVAATSGTATATAAATTETINIIKDGKTATLTLNIPGVTAAAAFGTVTAVTVN